MGDIKMCAVSCVSDLSSKEFKQQNCEIRHAVVEIPKFSSAVST